jgi:hypothetical protein
MIKAIIIGSVLTAAFGTSAAFAQEPTRTIHAFGEPFTLANPAPQQEYRAYSDATPTRSEPVHVTARPDSE